DDVERPDAGDIDDGAKLLRPLVAPEQLDDVTGTPIGEAVHLSGESPVGGDEDRVVSLAAGKPADGREGRIEVPGRPAGEQVAAELHQDLRTHREKLGDESQQYR